MPSNPTLIAELRSIDPRKRQKAIAELIALKDPANVSGVIEIWQHPMRITFLRRPLRWIGIKTVDYDHYDQASAFQVLAEAGPEAIEPLCKAYAQHQSGKNRLSDQQVEQLAVLLSLQIANGNHGNDLIQQAPLPGTAETRRITCTLLSLLRDKTIPGARESAIHGLAVQKPQTATLAETLMQLVENRAEENAMRLHAAEALMVVQHNDCLARLGPLLSTATHSLRHSENPECMAEYEGEVAVLAQIAVTLSHWCGKDVVPLFCAIVDRGESDSRLIALLTDLMVMPQEENLCLLLQAEKADEAATTARLRRDRPHIERLLRRLEVIDSERLFSPVDLANPAANDVLLYATQQAIGHDMGHELIKALPRSQVTPAAAPAAA